ncbi:hypothetical protein FHT39_003775 [Mitsuaria sp. BK045]|uniref:hypothetical protein n=1 Tax=unclassified Roseateles TaxID=2626991 RepID=UPI0016171ECC|nr:MULTISPECIES: hypothetical protein [unclassified Roseateles]MBB3295095.1 hypothetical protein [Mitsuaria sp. BK041]MBB3364311.1 hypothetical protein [Mitsuaria sp. BK045]
MSEPSSPEDLKLPGVFRYGAFYDLLADAAFQHKHAANAAEAADGYSSQRFARASILASALGVECAANCLMATLDIPKALLEELDRMPPLAKIDACLRLRGLPSIAYGMREVQAIRELVTIRNQHVHPRATNLPAELSTPQDADTHWMLPMSLEGEYWPILKIPKQPMFWSNESSQAVLQAVTSFHRYLFQTLMAINDDDLQKMLSSRLEVGEMHMMAVFDEIRLELEGAKQWGADLEFLGVFLPPGSAPLPPFHPRKSD